MEQEQPAQTDAKPNRSRVGCLSCALIFIPIIYLLSIPWVVQIVRPVSRYGGRGDWTDDAVNSYTYPADLLYERSDTYRAFLTPYGRLVRRVLEKFDM